MKRFVELRRSLLALLSAGYLLATTCPVGLPQNAQSVPPQRRTYPNPTNLRVLPKAMTGERVYVLMKQWETSLGMHCDSCHAEDRENLGPDGAPLLDFADDSKPMKDVARTMYRMTERINSDYLAKIDSSGMPVTCGTCHRGHLGPEPFVASPEKASRPLVNPDIDPGKRAEE